MCVCVCVCRVSYRILSFGKGATPKFGVDVEGAYSTKQLRWSRGKLYIFLFFKRCSKIDSEAFWEY